MTAAVALDSRNLIGVARRELDEAAPANRADSLLRVWPAAGMTGVPTQWLGSETPDPLAGYQGRRDNVGPVVFVVGLRPPFRMSVADARGRPLPILLPKGRDAVTTLSVGTATEGYFISSHAVFIARRLSAGAAYTLKSPMPTGGTR